MKILRKSHNYLYSLPRIKFILLITIISFFFNRSIMIPIFFIAKKLGHFNISAPPPAGIFIDILSSLLFAPLLETLLFQKLIINICIEGSLKNKNKYYIAIFISSLCFGLAHIMYGILYSLSGFLTGLFLAYSYIVYNNKNDKPFLTTTLIHSALNMIAFGLAFILK